MVIGVLADPTSMPMRSVENLELFVGGRLTIDLAAIRANYRLISQRIRPAVAAAVVKANAYGLGASRVAPALYGEGCHQFFVAHLSEAADLRPSLPQDVQIYVLNGLQPGAEAACLLAGARPVLNSLDQIAAWSKLAAARGEALPAAVQVDTGMSRLGLSACEVDEALACPARLAGVEPTLLMSHLACADEPANAANREQLTLFRAMAERLPGAKLSLANSGGAFLGVEYHFDVARPGVALYGFNPIEECDAVMAPVVRLEATVIQLREVPAGTGVGYGLAHRSAGPARLATIAVGYADGWRRRLGDRGSAYFNGVRLPIVGRVSMDSITLDVSALAPDVLRPGCRVELIGPNQTLEQVAADADTIAYEILTSLGPRFHRVYVDRDLTPNESDAS